MTKITLPTLAILLAVSACGTSPTDRAVTGGGLGAATGAAVGGLAGGSAVNGALIGGAIGAVGGAVTDSNQVNLGKPIYK